MNLPVTDSRSVPTARPLSCHPEPAKDLTRYQTAFSDRASSSKLMTSNETPFAPTPLETKNAPVRPREIPSTDSGQALRKLPMNLPVGDRRSAPTARTHTSLGQRPTAIKLRNSRSRSQAPAWERPCLGGSSLPFLSGALCFWRPGRRLEPPGILHSQAGAWERARVTRSSKLNLMAVGRCPRLLWGWAVGPEMRQAMPGSCPTITLALWRG